MAADISRRRVFVCCCTENTTVQRSKVRLTRPEANMALNADGKNDSATVTSASISGDQVLFPRPHVRALNRSRLTSLRSTRASTMHRPTAGQSGVADPARLRQSERAPEACQHAFIQTQPESCYFCSAACPRAEAVPAWTRRWGLDKIDCRRNGGVSAWQQDTVGACTA